MISKCLFQRKHFTTVIFKTLESGSPLDGRYSKNVDELRDIYSPKGSAHLKETIEDKCKLKLSPVMFSTLLLELAYQAKFKDKMNQILEKSFVELLNSCTLSKKLVHPVFNGVTSNSYVLLSEELFKYKRRLDIGYNEINSLFVQKNLNFPTFKGDEIILYIKQKGLLTDDQLRDDLSKKFNHILQENKILVSLCIDLWGYTSQGYFKLKIKQGEIGSSTMPHKVNPIDFENAEGNLGVCNSYLSFFVNTLTQTRFQGDSTYQVVYENIGSALGYSFISYASLSKGLSKLEVNDN